MKFLSSVASLALFAVCTTHADKVVARRTSLSATLSVRGGWNKNKKQVTVYSDKDIPAGTADVAPEIFNIIKSIVGAGVLGLPAGIAAFGNAQSALVPAMAVLVMIGSMACFGFLQIGDICSKTASVSYKQAWSRSVSPQTSWMPNLACTLVTAFAVTTYSIILADTVPSIIKVLTGFTLARRPTLLGFTTLVLLPLCLLRKLSSLAPFSLLGILGMVYTSAIMTLRWLTGAYSGGSAATFISDPQYRPSFGTQGWKSAFSPTAAILVSMLSTAFMAHYNAPKFYWELKDRSKFQSVVTASFGGSILLMMTATIAGFSTFGGACDSLILNNYASSDRLMTLSRAAVTVSLIFSYPLAFYGVREGLMDLAQVPEDKKSKVSDGLTLILLTIIMSLAMVLTDIRVVLALSGATFGNMLVYVFPAIMTVSAARNFPELKGRKKVSIFTGVLGLCLGIVGTIQAIQSM